MDSPGALSKILSPFLTNLRNVGYRICLKIGGYANAVRPG